MLQFGRSQTGIHGKVVDLNDQPVSNANVLLLKAADSSLVTGMFTNETGSYNFQKIASGKYLITSTYLGFTPAYSPVFESNVNDHLEIGTIKLVEENLHLAEVTITAKKPLLEQKIDRLVINVAASITSAGNTALEVLERSPGVIVDHQNNSISMNGKDGVILMVNGKISHMPIAAAVQMLAGMSSGNIEKIELISTPPANFDAAGNAGYINVVLKANNNVGTNGSFSASVGYGKGWVEQLNINFNHRRGKVNVYGDLSLSRLNKPFPILSYNKIIYQGDINENFFDGHRRDITKNINGRLGIDFEVSKRTVLGVLLSGYDNYYTQTEHNENLLVKNNQLDTIVKLSNDEINDWKSLSTNINMQHIFNSDENLSVNVDYIHYSNHQPVNYFSSYYNRTGIFAYDQRSKSGKETPIDFWVGAVDYIKKLNEKLSIDAGCKVTSSAFRNDVSFDRLIQNTWQKDVSLSEKYHLDESYSAVYSSLNYSANTSTEAKLGLRYEYTNTNLGTTAIKDIVDRHYGNLFPSFFISRKLSENNAINFSYNMRITRPTINDLAPFTYYATANTLITGNPALQASLSNTFKTAYTFKKYLFSLSYSIEDHAISAFQPSTDPATNKVILSPENLKNQKILSAIVSVPVTINKWWAMQYNVTSLWQEINAFYKKAPVKLTQVNFNINVSQSFKLPKDFSAELSGFYQSRFLDGISLRKAFGSLDFGIKKKFGGNKGALLLNVSDIFRTMVYAGSTNLPEHNLVSSLNLRFTQRTCKLTYSRSFGKEKLKEKRERATGAEDEKGRVQ